MRPLLVPLLMVLLLVSGCASTRTHSNKQPCSGEFTLAREPQPLGSSEQLLQEIRKAHDAHQPIPFSDITRAAGWSAEWDRMVDVTVHADLDELNGTAQTPGYCWDGLPPDLGSNFAPTGYYVFVRDHKPVQSVWYKGEEQPLQLRRRAVVLPQTVMVIDGATFGPESN